MAGQSITARYSDGPNGRTASEPERTASGSDESSGCELCKGTGFVQLPPKEGRVIGAVVACRWWSPATSTPTTPRVASRPGCSRVCWTGQQLRGLFQGDHLAGGGLPVGGAAAGWGCRAARVNAGDSHGGNKVPGTFRSARHLCVLLAASPTFADTTVASIDVSRDDAIWR